MSPFRQQPGVARSYIAISQTVTGGAIRGFGLNRPASGVVWGGVFEAGVNCSGNP